MPNRLKKSETFNPASGQTLDLDYLALLFDRFELVELTFAAARASLARFRPGLRTAKVGIPERPRATLPRSIFVDGTASLLVVEEYTVAIFKLF